MTWGWSFWTSSCGQLVAEGVDVIGAGAEGGIDSCEVLNMDDEFLVLLLEDLVKPGILSCELALDVDDVSSEAGDLDTFVPELFLKCSDSVFMLMTERTGCARVPCRIRSRPSEKETTCSALYSSTSSRRSNGDGGSGSLRLGLVFVTG